MAIERAQMMSLLLEACPTFRGAWESVLQEWPDQSSLPLYPALGDLARHLISMLEAKEHQLLSSTFRVVERWIVEGDSFVRESAIIGLLESLQNEDLHSTTGPQEFLQYLGPESVEAWDELNDGWSKRMHSRH